MTDPYVKTHDIELHTYGVATGIDPPEIAKLRNEAMRMMLENIAFTSGWTRGIAAVAVAEKKKAAEKPADIVSTTLEVRKGWFWQITVRRDGIRKEQRGAREADLNLGEGEGEG